MKRIARFLLPGVLVLALTAVPASAITIDFASLPGGGIHFNGAASSFDFVGSPFFGGWQMWVTSVTGGPGTSLGDPAIVAGGPWSYGPIAVSGPNETATVLGPLGALSIWDGAFALTGTVNWVEISTHGTIGGINSHLVMNVTGIAYAGADPDLLLLAAFPTATMDVSFQFSPGMTLTQLTTGPGPYISSYSASISNTPVPDGGMTLALLGLGLAGLGILRRKIG